MFDPAYLLAQFGGIARGRFLQRFGCTRKQLAAEVDAGAIVRVRPGVFALPATDPAIVGSAAHGGALSCAGALRAYGVWVLPQPDGRIHVWMGEAGRTHAPACTCVTHYSAGRADLGLAPIAAALVHAYRCLDEETFFAAYESAWNKRLLSASDRARIRRELPQSAHWLLDLARPDSESGLESLIRLRLHLLGINVECQVSIDGVGRVDFLIDRRVILEADGRLNHEAGLRHKDLMRDAAASALGYETLRFDYAMIVHDWATVVAALLPALDRARV